MIQKSTIAAAAIFCLLSLLLGLMLQYRTKKLKAQYTNISPTSFLPEEAYHPHKGSFIDPRDGRKYKTIQLFDQLWMAENLQFNIGSNQSFCYDNEGVNCQKFGRLYSWNAAKKACPPGWRLPSDKDWNRLYVQLGNVKECYNALSYGGYMGFDARFGGWRAQDLSYRHKGTRAYFWSKDRVDNAFARYYRLDSDKKIFSSSNAYRELAFSCRCLKE